MQAIMKDPFKLYIMVLIILVIILYTSYLMMINHLI